VVTPCSTTAIDEPLVGTAPQIRIWIAVEHPGPWSATAVADMLDGFEPPTGVRIVAIRQSRTSTGQVFIADSREALLHRHLVTNPRDICSWDFEELAQGVLPGSPTDANPILVCTNGRRDQCCAVAGRALLDHHATWECTHLGGHRFAPVVLRLRDGYLFGRVTPEILEDIARGETPLAHARGRTWLPPGDQAAQILVPDTNPGQVRAIEEPMDLIRPESCGATPRQATRWRIIGEGVD